MSTLYTAKFNINENIHKVEKGELELNNLLNTIFKELNQQDKVTDTHDEDITYKFVNLDRDYDSMILTGRMIKYYDGVNSRYIEEEDTVIDEHTSNKADYITFSFDFKTEIVGFVPKRSFSKEAFMNFFELLVAKMVPEVGIVVLVLVVDAAELDAKFKKIDLLKEIQIDIIPENNDGPELASMIEILIDPLKDSNAQHMSINLKGTKREPLIKKSELVSNFRGMAKKAYARFIAVGYKKNGESYNIDTRKDTLLKRNILDNEKDSMPAIKELTQDAAKDYISQRAEEVKRNGGKG